MCHGQVSNGKWWSGHSTIMNGMPETKFPGFEGYPNPFTIIHHSSWPSSFIWKKLGSKPLESFFCIRISGKPYGLL